MKILSILAIMVVLGLKTAMACEAKGIFPSPGTNAGFANFDCRDWQQVVTFNQPDLVIQADVEPWISISKLDVPFHLIIFAKTIRVQGRIRMHPVDLKIAVERIEFTEDGELDLTPTDFETNEIKIGERPYRAMKGKSGPDVRIVANDLSVYGDTSRPRVIADGGSGETAPNGFDGAQRPGKPICSVDSLTKQMICVGRDAISGGAPGPGGDGGHVSLKILNLQDVPFHVVAARPGGTGKPDRMRRGESISNSQIADIQRTIGNPIPIRRQTGQDGLPATSQIPPGNFGHIYRSSLPDALNYLKLGDLDYK